MHRYQRTIALTVAAFAIALTAGSSATAQQRGTGKPASQVQDGALHGFVGGDALVFDDAEVAMVLAVFLPVCAA